VSGIGGSSFFLVGGGTGSGLGLGFFAGVGEYGFLNLGMDHCDDCGFDVFRLLLNSVTSTPSA
jgi:hypothetical protein